MKTENKKAQQEFQRLGQSLLSNLPQLSYTEFGQGVKEFLNAYSNLARPQTQQQQEHRAEL